MKKIYNSPELEIVKFAAMEAVAAGIEDLYSQEGDWREEENNGEE